MILSELIRRGRGERILIVCPRHVTEEFLKPKVAGMLLYQPRLLLHDTVSDFFYNESLGWIPEMRTLRWLHNSGERRDTLAPLGEWIKSDLYSTYCERDDIASAKAHVDIAVQRIVQFSPLIRSGAILLRPQMPILHENINRLMASVRSDTKSDVMLQVAVEEPQLTQWDMLQGMRLSLQGGTIRASDRPWQWQTEFLYLAKSIAIAHAYGATYAPTHSPDWRLLRAKLKDTTLTEKTFINSERRSEVLSEVAHVSLHSAAIPAATVAKIRNDEAAFEDWRRALREVIREADNVQIDEILQIVADHLASLSKKISKPLKAASLAKSAIHEVPIEAGFCLASSALGTPLEIAVPAAAVGGMVSWIRDMYCHRSDRAGASGIFMRLRDS